MSDIAVDLNASALHSVLTTTNGFDAQNSGDTPRFTEENHANANGETVNDCVHVHDTGKDYTNDAIYCGTGLFTALGALLTALGSVDTGVLWTELGIEFPGPSQDSNVTLAGHDHTTNTHSATTNPCRTYDVSALVGTALGLGVPGSGKLGITWTGAATCSQIAASLTFTVNHNDQPGNAGHLVGENQGVRAELSITFKGNPGTLDGSSGGWKGQNAALGLVATRNDSNTEFDEYVVNAYRYFTS